VVGRLVLPVGAFESSLWLEKGRSSDQTSEAEWPEQDK
jgi:hypothetical protein